KAVIRTTGTPAAGIARLAGAGKFGVIGNLPRFNPFAGSVDFCNSQVVVVLKIEPKLCRQTEILPQANGSFGTDGPVSADDLIDAGKTECLRQFISAHAHWLHEFGLEN